jgi:anti-sigma regulatory factor (Ser/Thr protein kinase)
VGGAGPDRIDEVVRAAVDELLSLPGVRRVGVALSEGGGRRLRFTASDRDHSGSVEWCHIDAYDDVPVTSVLRSGEAVISTLERLQGRYAGFVEHQRRQSTVAVAALPLPGTPSPIGAVILFYTTAESFDSALRSELDAAADELATELRAAQAMRPRAVLSLAQEPVQPGSVVADLSLEPDPGALRGFRQQVRASLLGWGVEDEAVDDTLLCVSELVTNALIHTGSGCEVRLMLDPHALTVTVRDQGVARQALRGDEASPDQLRVHGRGLQLVDALASRWGSVLDAGGRSVWFAMEAPAPDDAALRQRPTA